MQKSSWLSSIVLLLFAIGDVLQGVTFAREPGVTHSQLYKDLEIWMLSSQELKDEFGNADQLEDFRSFYIVSATPVQGKPVPGKPAEAGRNRSWALETDRGTGLTYVRIVSLTDQTMLDAVNRQRDAVHGWILGWSTSLDLIRRSEFMRVDMIHRSVYQNIVEVTYLSDRIVSTLETGVTDTDSNVNGGGMPYARGTTMDLTTQKMFDIESCGDGTTPFFRIGPYFDFCTAGKYQAFHDLRIRRGKALSQTKPSIRRHRADPFCDDLDYERDMQSDSFTVYLTPAGQAVHAKDLRRTKGDRCTVERNSFNPVILPYRDLEAFMKVGPLKDELLTAAR